jgi:hypothetical protein
MTSHQSFYLKRHCPVSQQKVPSRRYGYSWVVMQVNYSVVAFCAREMFLKTSHNSRQAFS